MGALGLHLGQQFVGFLGFGDEVGRAQQTVRGTIDLAFAPQF